MQRAHMLAVDAAHSLRRRVQGNTKVAIYGLGFMREERLARSFQMPGQVVWLRPSERPEDWLNIFVLHQNRVQHYKQGPNNKARSIRPEFLPEWLDWVRPPWPPLAHRAACRLRRPTHRCGGVTALSASLWCVEKKTRNYSRCDVNRAPCAAVQWVRRRLNEHATESRFATRLCESEPARCSLLNQLAPRIAARGAPFMPRRWSLHRPTHPAGVQVVWGHEHECVRTPDKLARGFSVLQPGSTVATSLSEPESKPKHCFLLELHEDQFRSEPIPLRTVRPFKFGQARAWSLGVCLRLAGGGARPAQAGRVAAGVAAGARRGARQPQAD